MRSIDSDANVPTIVDREESNDKSENDRTRSFPDASVSERSEDFRSGPFELFERIEPCMKQKNLCFKRFSLTTLVDVTTRRQAPSHSWKYRRRLRCDRDIARWAPILKSLEFSSLGMCK